MKPYAEIPNALNAIPLPELLMSAAAQSAAVLEEPADTDSGAISNYRRNAEPELFK
jgi:hypothetical protein